MPLSERGPNAAEPNRRAGWHDVVHALPMPAAIVDDRGHVLAANRWITAASGEALIATGGELGKGLRLGRDGTSRWRVRPLTEDGSALLAMGEREDVGDHLLRRFFSTGDTLFVIYDQSGRIIESNTAWESMLGYSRDEVFGLDSWSLLPEEDLIARAAVEQDLRDRGRSEPTWRMRAADGTYRVVQWTLHFDPTVGRCFGVGRDVSESAERADELHRRVFTDELTGLANRRRLLAELERCLTEDSETALLFCDLDHFKVVNDSLGHIAGDELLAALGRRLSAAIGGSDRLVARLGGDEFAVILTEADVFAATDVALEIIDLVQRPFRIADRELHVGVSIGIAISDHQPGRSVEQLLGRADLAAYEAKRNGRNRVAVFDDAMQDDVDRRLEIEAGLRAGLVDDAFELHYQPIVSLETGATTGYEALLRWRVGDTIRSAGEFLDVAIEAGLMPRISETVLPDAAAVAAALSLHDAPTFVAVNMSAAELSDVNFEERLFALLDAVGADPARLLIEITESTVLETDQVIDTLAALRRRGVRIGLDDFGTGFSSLAHLRRLPIDMVKIDRSFVRDLSVDETTRAVTASLIELCHALGLEVVLEGVEHEHEAAAIRELGGRIAQGWLFGRALPADTILATRDTTPT